MRKSIAETELEAGVNGFVLEEILYVAAIVGIPGDAWLDIKRERGQEFVSCAHDSTHRPLQAVMAEMALHAVGFQA